METSKGQHKINELNKKCTNYFKSNLAKKKVIAQFHKLVKKLIDEGRLTKEEANQFIKKREK